MTAKASIRVELWYTPDERLHSEPVCDGYASRKGAWSFATPPAAGDKLFPNTLPGFPRGLPVIHQIEHGPATPDEDPDKAEAIVVVRISSDQVFDDDTFQALRDAGWNVTDRRAEHGHARR